MKKRLSKILVCLLTLCMLFNMLGMTSFAEEVNTPADEIILGPDEGTIEKSKTATPLDKDFFSKVTLTVGGSSENYSSDIVFVIDKSSSDTFSKNEATALLHQLVEQQKKSNASIKIGFVIFNYTSHVALPLTELTEDNVESLLTNLDTFKSGTNIAAGLIEAKKMLDADDTVIPSRKHMILISDGLTWLFNDEKDNPVTIVYNHNGSVMAGTTGWTLTRGVDSTYPIPSRFENWDAYWNQVKLWVEQDGNTYVQPYNNYTIEKALTKAEGQDHAQCMDRALYEAWKAYDAMQSQGYSCYAVNTNSNSNSIGYNLMTMLNGGASINFEALQDHIIYAVSSGSYVEDYIGYKENEYDFTFVDDAEALELKVGEIVYQANVVSNTKEGVTSTYEFMATGAETAGFTLEYYQGNTTTTERFVWTFHENISNFAPVSLTYKVQLTTRILEGGQYEAETNQKAVIYPKDSDEEDGTPEEFEKPTVEYTNPIEITLAGTKYLDDEAGEGFEFVLKDEAGEIIETVKSGADGKFVFTTLTYGASGEYKYTISEVIGEDETIVYDETVYNVTVNVVLEGDKFVANVESDADEVIFGNKTTEDAEATLGGTKYLDDEAGEGFEFVLKDADGNVIETVKSGADGKFVFTTLTYGASGEYKYTISEVIGDDETIVYDETVYNVTVTVVREGDAFVADVAIDAEEIVFNNETVVVDIPEEDVPLIPDVPEEPEEPEVDIPDEDVPLVPDAPATGGEGPIALIILATASAAMMAVMLFTMRKLRKEI